MTTIDYYLVINHPITEYKTAQEVLKYSKNATHEVSQEYTITTFDLGVCMKAYPIILYNPQRYSKHVVLIGTFHSVCAYMKMVGEKMAGTSFNDVLIEAGLIPCESLMSGKNYGKSTHCHKIVLEVLERLLFEKFMSSQNEDTLCSDKSEISRAKIHDLLENP